MNAGERYKAVEALLREYAKDLRADDPRFNHDVRVIHEDGSSFFWKSAFLVSVKTRNLGTWVAVFAEHDGHHFWDPDELKDWQQYKRTKVSVLLSDR